MRVLDFRPSARVTIEDVQVIQNGPFKGRVYGRIEGVKRQLTDREVQAVDEAGRLRMLVAQIPNAAMFEELLAHFPEGAAREAARAVWAPLVTFDWPEESPTP